METNYWQRFTEGDEAAFEEIYYRHASMLYGYGIKLVNNPMLVRECIQSLFIYLYERRKTLKEPDNISCYLIACLRNSLYKEHKKALFSDMNTKELFELSIDMQRTMELNELKEECIEALQKALAMLSPQQREVVYLRYNRNMSVAEVASIIGISSQTVKNVASTALARLRQNEKLARLVSLKMLVALLICVAV